MPVVTMYETFNQIDRISNAITVRYDCVPHCKDFFLVNQSRLKVTGSQVAEKEQIVTCHRNKASLFYTFTRIEEVCFLSACPFEI